MSADCPTLCPTCADLRADVDHWRNMAAMYLAAAKAGIAAKPPMRPALPPMADAEPSGAHREGSADLRAAERRTA